MTCVTPARKSSPAASQEVQAAGPPVTTPRHTGLSLAERDDASCNGRSRSASSMACADPRHCRLHPRAGPRPSLSALRRIGRAPSGWSKRIALGVQAPLLVAASLTDAVWSIGCGTGTVVHEDARHFTGAVTADGRLVSTLPCVDASPGSQPGEADVTLAFVQLHPWLARPAL
eukprot:scaffold16445_cov33-Tisochrysis_lutea.AAC.2